MRSIRFAPSFKALLLVGPLLVGNTASALDKQGSAHGGGANTDAKGFDVSGNVAVGTAFYNPSYAARPDNSGRALMRYAGHLDLDLVGPHLSIPLDLNLFTDRLRHGGGAFAPSELDLIAGLTSTEALGPGAIELGARVEHDRPVDKTRYTQTYGDVRVRYLLSTGDRFPRLKQLLHGGGISGWATLGWFAVNPSYAARPNNTGLALFRYALHGEVSGFKERFALGVDTTFFTDRQASAMRPSELDLTFSATWRFDPFSLQIALERDLPLDRPGFVQQFAYAMLAYQFGA